MNQRLLLWGLAGATFVVTLGITSWQSGLWTSQEPPAMPANVAPTTAVTPAPESTALPTRPFAPTRSTPMPPPPVPAVAQAVVPAPPPVPAEDTSENAHPQPDRKPLVTNPDEQEFHAHADRAAVHGPRSH